MYIGLFTFYSFLHMLVFRVILRYYVGIFFLNSFLYGITLRIGGALAFIIIELIFERWMTVAEVSNVSLSKLGFLISGCNVRGSTGLCLIDIVT